MKKKHVTYLMVLVLSACRTDRDETAQKSLPVLAGVLRANLPSTPLNYFTLNEDMSGVPISRNGDLKIQGNSTTATIDGDGVDYHLPEDFMILPDSTYRISVNDYDLQTSPYVEVVVPPEIHLINGITDTIHLNAVGSIAGLIDWNNLDDSKYSYVLILDCLEENPVALPEGFGLFANRYSGPQLPSQLLLLKSDFGFYGLHQLTVLAIDRDFDALFFYDPADLRGLLKDGPGNVVGASGYVAGASGFQTQMIISD